LFRSAYEWRVSGEKSEPDFGSTGQERAVATGCNLAIWRCGRHLLLGALIKRMFEIDVSTARLAVRGP
jgi:hypothetical protein